MSQRSVSAPASVAGTAAPTTVVDFVMPSLGADMEEGAVTEWLVSVGDRVARGDIVVIVETEKADIDVEVWNDGVIVELLVEPGRSVAVGTPMARLRVEVAGDGTGPTGHPSDEGPTAPSPIDDGTPVDGTPLDTDPARRQRTAAIAPPDRAAVPARVDRTPASPLARRLAATRGLDLAAVAGSGPGGAVVARDLGGEPADREPPTPDPSERMRRAIADLMSRANRDIPHYHLAETIDLEPSLAWLERVNVDRPLRQRILPAALLLRGVAAALAANPELNGFWVGGRFRPGDGIHLGVAIALRGGGLVAPAIRDADRLDLVETMSALRQLVERARAGRLRGSEMSSATATVTNLGDHGAEVVNGVIHPPQVALIGFGRIETRPAVVGDEVVPRRLVIATLAADHRASDGQRGSRFLNDLRRHLSRPEEL